MFRFFPNLPKSRRRLSRYTVRRLGEALNRRDYDALRSILTTGCTITEVGVRTFVGVDAIVAMMAQVVVRFPQLEVALDTLDYDRGAMLARCHFENGPEWLTGRSLWHLQFEDDRICRIEVTRGGSADNPAVYANASAPPLRLN